MRTAMLGLSVVLLLGWTGSITFAADAPHGATAGARYVPRPVLPEPSALPGAVIIVIAGMFLAAATVGPVVRYHAPEEVPDASSHDEHRHGAHDAHGGTHHHGH